MVAALLGIVDILAAAIIAVMDVPYIGVFKWIIISVLLAKGVASLITT